MLRQPIMKSGPASVAVQQKPEPLLQLNLSNGEYNLIYSPGFLSSPWLTFMGKNGIVISLGVRIDHLLHLGHTIQSLSSFLAKVQKGMACKLTNKPAMADLKMIRAARDMMDCHFTGTVKAVYCELKLSNLLVMALAGISGQANADKMVLKPLDVEKIEATRRYLFDNMDHPPTLIRLARKMGINDYKLKKAYKQLYGTTLFEDFLHARMDKAKTLLQDTSQSIVGIAETVGYKNVSSFAVAFKKYFGCPPGEYRIKPYI